MIKDKLNKNHVKYNMLNKHNLKVILPLSISFALVFIIAFISVTYSWVFSTYFTDIVGVNIALVDSQGLVMLLNGEVTQTIDINNYLGGDLSTFSLKETSSTNGRDLFLRDLSTYYIDEQHLYDNIDVARDNAGIIKFRSAVEDDENESFIYFKFTLESTGENRYLVFDSANSYIKDIYDDPIYPIRLSFTFVNGEVVTSKIVGNRQEYLGNYFTEAVASIDSTTKVGYTSNQNVNSFEGYNGYNGATFSESKTLCYLQQGDQIDVYVRIWLEGGDPLCVDAISGSLLDIALRFDNISESEVL